jgi:hypothetical protein
MGPPGPEKAGHIESILHKPDTFSFCRYKEKTKKTERAVDFDLKFVIPQLAIVHVETRDDHD